MKARPKTRADDLIVELGLAADVGRARALIMSGRVVATDPDGHEQKIEKAGVMLRAGSTLRITGDNKEFVSRAGGKLDRALDALGVRVEGRVCADLGIGTGGFTDALLRRGAQRVHGVDVGYGDVAWVIRKDPRVVLYERTNARLLEVNAFGERVELIVIDVSFISLAQILPAAIKQLAEHGDIVALIKPQFEVEPEDAPGGVVVDDGARRRAIERVAEAARALGLELRGHVPSSVPGADGNVEELAHFAR